MKTLSIDELKNVANQVFAEHDVKEVYATEDGNIFLNNTLAKQHASVIKSEKIHTIIKPEKEETAAEKKAREKAEKEAVELKAKEDKEAAGKN